MAVSEDESSDSSDDFLIPADKINLSSSFFDEKSTSNSNRKPDENTFESSNSEDEVEDIKAEDVDNAQSAELFSEILKNLEREKDLENLRKAQFQKKDTTKDVSQGESSKSRGLVNEINELLLQGESAVASSSFENNNEEDEEEDETKPETSAYTIPTEGVQITLQGETKRSFLEQKKKKTDLETLLKNKLNQRIRTTQVLVHKVGLLWWLVYGFHLNRLANDPEILATCLSLISKNDYPKGRVDLVYLQRITMWFKKSFSIDSNRQERILSTESLLELIREKKTHDYRELVLIYVALLRAIGLKCRLVVSLSPPPLKPKREQLFQTNKKEEEPKKELQEEKGKNQKKKSATKSKSKKTEKKESLKLIAENSQEGRKNAQLEARKKAAALLQKGKPDKKTEKGIKGETKLKSASKSESTSKIEKTSKSEDSKSHGETKIKSSSKASEKEKLKKEEGEEIPTISTKLRKRITKPPVREPLPSIEMDDEEDSDEEFVFRKSTRKVKTERILKNNRKLISTSEEEEIGKKKIPEDVWVEVYVESEESWICVNIVTAKIHCVNEIYKRASDPVLYIIAYNSGGSVKDVTRRYCPNWLTVTRKQRVEENWWRESLAPWEEEKTAMSKAEDEMLLQKELEQPLPKTVSECKGHPFYVLVRHLLKFEALYPPDVVPLGYLKNGEAIYSRHCVHTLRSRETWVRHARVVKPAQEAYKVVKSMPKYDKFSGSKVKGLPLDLFGKWQTTPYIPPEAKDGIVPRNEYGNVDLFKMSMIPKGTVHIDLPGLNRIARKLNIDCAPAVVGFNFGGMGAVPAFEGFIVCAEFEDTLREAWEAEQIEASKRAREKRDKRIYGNWRKLIRGLLIRERLAARYSQPDPGDSDQEEEPVPVVRQQDATKRRKKTEKESAAKDEEDEEDEKPATKKAKHTKKAAPPKKEPPKKEPPKKEPPKKELKSTSRGKKTSEDVATSSNKSKRVATAKKNCDEKEDSDSDFEPKKLRRETRSQRNKIS